MSLPWLVLSAAPGTQIPPFGSPHTINLAVLGFCFFVMKKVIGSYLTRLVEAPSQALGCGGGWDGQDPVLLGSVPCVGGQNGPPLTYPFFSCALTSGNKADLRGVGLVLVPWH